MLRSLIATIHLSALAAAGTFGADAYDRVSPSVLDAIAPVAAAAWIAVVLVVGVLGTREAPRGRRDS